MTRYFSGTWRLRIREHRCEVCIVEGFFSLRFVGPRSVVGAEKPRTVVAVNEGRVFRTVAVN